MALENAVITPPQPARASPAHDAFSATLTVPQRRLSARLEGFGDIVFGFAVSQCALQLPTAHDHVTLAHPVALLLYFGTFALLASLWLTYHRLMSGTYRPGGIDLTLAFTYLAFVSLMPYAMYALSHEEETLSTARSALAAYTTIFAILMAIAIALTLRNLRRGWWFVDSEERELIWITLVRRSVVCVMMLLALAVDLTRGPAATTIPFVCIYPAIRIIRLLVKRAPSAALLRIHAVEPAPAGTV